MHPPPPRHNRASAIERPCCTGHSERPLAAYSAAFSASNSANFELNGNAATMATGPAVATTWALWKIVLEHQGATGPKVYAYRNGTAFSTTPGTGAQDEFPLKFGFHALTTNRIGLGLTHIYCDY